MIELPEAIHLAREISLTLKGKQVEQCVQGSTPLKFAFVTGTPEEYAQKIKGKIVGEAYARASAIVVPLLPDHALVLGNGGERIFFHRDDTNLPKKHQLWLTFSDGTHLTVSIQMWGAVQLFHQNDLTVDKNYYGYDVVSPLSPEFDWDYFNGLFEGLAADSKDALKFFIISKPGVSGIGNGYLQDILFKARLHPRRKALDLSAPERRALFDAIRDVLKRATDAGGRESELDLFGRPGGYAKILDSKSAGQPCAVCGTMIEKIQFMGGAAYFCPTCQK